VEELVALRVLLLDLVAIFLVLRPETF
jgi:hypothetical protein